MKKFLGKCQVWMILGGGASLLSLLGCETKKLVLSGERTPVSLLTTAKELSSSKMTSKVISLSEPAPCENWPQADRLSSHNKGHIAFAHTPKGLRVLWSQNVSSSDAEARLLATPAVTAKGIFLLNHQGFLVRVDPRSGEVLYRVSVMPEDKEGEPALGGGCVVEGETVFVATSHGELVALQAESGEILWKVGLQSPARAAPTVADGTLYVSTLQNQLQAFDLKGALLWTHAGMPELLGILGLSSPAVSGDVVVVTYTSGEVLALHRQTGNVLWAEMIGGGRHLGEAQNVPHIRANPVIHQNVLYVISYSGHMVAFNLHNGHRLWELPVGGLQTPVFDGSTLFMVTHNQEIAALEAHSGQVLWAHPLSSFQGEQAKSENAVTWAGPLLAGGALCVLSNTGLVLTLDARTGRPLAAPPLALEDVFELPLVAAQGAFYALAESGRLYAIR